MRLLDPGWRFRCYSTRGRGQNAAEREICAGDGAPDYLSDRSVLDCLAYARWRSGQMPAEEGREAWARLLEGCGVIFLWAKLPVSFKYVGANFGSKAEISDSVARYRRSGLVVIVHPWRGSGGTKEDDDGVRWESNQSLAEELTEEWPFENIGWP